MSRTLILIRHAKSSWDQVGLQDFDRPLNKRGLKNAPDMGQRLKKKGFRTDIIISSPANRAFTTASLIADQINYDRNKIIQQDVMYDASLKTLIKLITTLDDNSYRVMLVGHNPGFTHLCNYLSNAQLDNLPTCGIAEIKFNVDTWNNIAEHSGELINFDFPKNKQ